jgi:hypothetical protein
LDTANQLAYTYAYTRRDVPAPSPIPGQLFATHPAVDFVLSARKDPEIIRELDVTIPNPGFDRARLDFTGIRVATPFSYGADIYLTPDEEEFRPRDVTFRERYLVDFLYIWKAHHHGAHSHHNDPAMTRNIAVDVTRALTSLARSAEGRRWKARIALVADDVTVAPMHGLEAVDMSDAVGSIDFRDVTLNLK